MWCNQGLNNFENNCFKLLYQGSNRDSHENQKNVTVTEISVSTCIDFDYRYYIGSIIVIFQFRIDNSSILHDISTFFYFNINRNPK